LIDDLIAKVPYAKQKGHWMNYLALLKLYATSSNWRIKQSSLFGIGILIQNTPNDETRIDKDEIGRVTKILKDAIGQKHLNPKANQKKPTLVRAGEQEQLDEEAEEDLSEYQSARDNAISALG